MQWETAVMLVETFRALGSDFKAQIGLKEHSRQINRSEVSNSPDVFDMQVICGLNETWVKRIKDNDTMYTFDQKTTLFLNSGADRLVELGAARIVVYEGLCKETRTFPSRHIFSQKQADKNKVAVEKAKATRQLNKAKKNLELAEIAASEDIGAEEMAELQAAIEERYEIQEVMERNEEIELF